MKVFVLGATGMIGSRIVAELRTRGHSVTYGVRPGSEVEGVAVDPRDVESIAAATLGHDAAVSALGGGTRQDALVAFEASRPLLDGLALSGCLRLLVVGGAGSLVRSDGRRVIDDPAFPEAWKPASQAQIRALENYLAYDGPVNWTYLSPSDVIAPGRRTGEVVLGEDYLLRDEQGHSFVSAEDYAVALVDELETAAHTRRRFTVRSARAALAQGRS